MTHSRHERDPDIRRASASLYDSRAGRGVG